MNARAVGLTILEFGRNGLAVPVMLLLIVGMMVVPLPAAALDFLFTLNMSLALVVVLAVVYVKRPLDIAVFPTVLLGATLMRLALNVASTRVVLLHGHEGTGAAGRVIESFGEFVIGGNYAVGLIVFVILVIINFVVVTKGAGRVSEVSARFTLDAMPGKQMAIDADLNAGIITSAEAQARRQEIREEADFYGSMDGASKFVRGDAIAGVLIVFINLFAGLVIGTLQHGLSFGEAGRNYSLLTIGDGLVAQIPALLLSVATAVLVTRMSRSADIGKAVAAQVLAQPRTLGIAAGILAVMGLIPGMPNFVFLAIASLLGGCAWLMTQRAARAAREPAPAAGAESVQPAARELVDLSWDEVETVDQVGLEVGYRLIPLVDRAQGGELMARIKGVRKKLSEDLGFLVPPVHIRDNLDLPAGGYRITIMGVAVGESEAFPDRELAINSGQVSGPLVGTSCQDPAFGLPAVWIDKARREHAQSLGYTVVDAGTVVATHLSQQMGQHAHELLGHEEVQQLLDRLKRSAPRLVEELVPKALPMSLLVRVLQNLLAERVPIRNLRVIGETLAEQAPRSQDAQVLTAACRVALGRGIVQEVAGLRQELSVMTLDSRLEDVLLQAMQAGEGGGGFEPGLADRLFKALTEGARRQQLSGDPTVLLVAPKLRSWIARLTRHALPGLTVLAYNEVPENRRINVVAAIGRAG
ncbi:MAG TPA: flagellar biosynthesis protein FlhA [Solirubrobacteraceae bacterium]|nr:flagellar biosynthesis protein FlhA [Solirubrobacteraceae bacterium]